MLTFLAVGLFFSPLLKAQYVFTQLDLLGTTHGGNVSVAANGNVLVTYLDSHNNPSSFLYSGTRYTLLEDINVGNKTVAQGTDGTSIVGAVEDLSKVGHGFVYTGGQFTTLDYPAAKETAAAAVSGSNVVGTYQDATHIGHGFLYNGGTYTSISYPGAHKTGVSAISGSNIVGTYEDTSGILHGFLYNGGTYTSISYPGATKTATGAVSGNNVLGVYQLSSTAQSGTGFLYSGGTYTSIAYPGSKETVVSGISGSNVVGTYTQSFNSNASGSYSNFNAIPHGFIYNAGTYTTIDVPGSRRTAITGIAGTNIVGAYEDINFVYHGFLAVPATKTLTLSGTLVFGSVPIHTTATATLAIKNTGNSPVTVSNITYPTGFSGSWSGPIAAGSTQNVTVTFAPITTISYGGSITVTSNATGSPTTIAVSGTGGAAVPGAVGPGSTVTPYSQWTAQYSLVSGPSATPLHDGIPNLLKYLYHIDPTVPLTTSARAALPTVGTTTLGGTAYLTLTYRQNQAATGLTVNVQTSTDLQSWTTVTDPPVSQAGTDPTTGDPIMQALVPISGPKQFLRLDVISP